MNDFIGRLIDHIHIAPPDFPIGPVLIYGCGSRGRSTARFLSAKGYEILGFADQKGHPEFKCDNLPVDRIESWTKKLRAKEITLVVAIHNPVVDMAALLNSLAQYGFSQIINPIGLHGIFGDELPDHYWLTSPANYGQFIDKLSALGSYFEERKSTHILQKVLEFRLSGNYELLPAPSLSDQYHPDDLPRWHGLLRFIDCGAFNGDTLLELSQAGYRFEAIAAFEPDQDNFQALTRHAPEIGPSICFPCGVSDQTKMLRFDALGDMASAITATGDQIIQCVTLDDALPSFSPTLIKMDIEGSEPDALKGAARIISENRPALAISAYHHMSHIWQIPALIDAWRLDYRFFLRLHGYSSFDLVLYAVPSDPELAGNI